MKSNQLKKTLLLLTLVLAGLTTRAQVNVQEKSGMDADRHNMYSKTTGKDGNVVEKVETNWNDHFYFVVLTNGKLTGLSIDGKKIPAADWPKHSEEIAELKAQIKRDEDQAKRDQAQARRDQEQAKRDQEQAARDQLQAQHEREQAMKDQQQAVKDQEQAKRDREQAARDQEQAKRDQEQAVRDQEQAKRDQAQAEEDRRLMKEMLDDLVSDKIAPDANSVKEITLNANGMTVNGVKQPDSVYQKYKEKYNRFALGDFTYGNEDGNQTFHGMHMSRQEP